MSKFKFDPNSERAKRGIAFQNNVQKQIEPFFEKTLNSRDWFLLNDCCLNDYQLNLLEKTWGDIVIIDKNIPYPVFVECVTLKGEYSVFPVSKIINFSGENKFYCFGWDDEKRFIPSKVWNSYANKCKDYVHFKQFSRKNILGMRTQFECVDSFCEGLMSLKGM